MEYWLSKDDECERLALLTRYLLPELGRIILEYGTICVTSPNGRENDSPMIFAKNYDSFQLLVTVARTGLDLYRELMIGNQHLVIALTLHFARSKWVGWWRYNNHGQARIFNTKRMLNSPFTPAGAGRRVQISIELPWACMKPHVLLACD